MTEHPGLRQACLDEPNDDGVSLIYADWLEDHGDPVKAEYIRVRIANERLSDLDLYDDELNDSWGYLAGLLRERIPQHMRDKIRTVDWHQGTRARASMTVANLVAFGEDIFRAIPDLYGMSFEADYERASELFASPLLRRLRSLGFHAYKRPDEEQERAIVELCECPHAGNLVELSLSINRLTPATLARVGDSLHLAGARSLEMFSAWINDAGAAALAVVPWLGELRRLCLWNNYLGSAGMASLFRSRAFPRLHELELSDNPLGSRGVQHLADSPGLGPLVQFELRNTNLGEDGLRSLASAPWLNQIARKRPRSGCRRWTWLSTDPFP